MVRRRRLMRSRKNVRTPSRFSRYLSAGASMAASALRGVSALKAIVNAESKNIDHAGTSSPTAGAAIVHLLTDVANGYLNGERNGLSIKVSSIYFNAIFSLGANTDNVCNFRVVLFRDNNDNNGVVPTMANVFQDLTIKGGIVSPLNIDNIGRYTILKDFIVTVDDSKARDIRRKFFVKLRNSHARYGGINGTDTSTGNIYIAFMTSQTTSVSAIAYEARVRYYDN